MAKVNPIIVLSQDDWTRIEAGVQDAVVQVCANSVTFDWEQPYIQGEQSESRGSGFFIDADGHIITTAHSVVDARLVWIRMPGLGAKPLFADIVGICPERDVALLKIRPEAMEFVLKLRPSIPYLMLGNSDAIAHTDRILALGYPLGQNNLKSSTGVISGRESGIGRTFFQITAPINPGSSGGPIFDTHGLVIGMTIAMVVAAQNVGYAVPVNDIAMVLADLYNNKLVRTGVLGARFNTCDDSQAQFFNNPIPAGLYINTIIKDSLFDKAGVQEGDMLYAFNGFKIDGSGHTAVPWTTDRVSIHDLVSRLTNGQKVEMIIFTKGERKDIQFTFEAQPPFPIRWLYPNHETVDYEILGGMIFMQLSDNHINQFWQVLPQLSEYLKMENKLNPVLIISHVIPGSAAFQNGSIQVGHLIKEINGKPIKELSELRSVLKLSLGPGF